MFINFTIEKELTERYEHGDKSKNEVSYSSSVFFDFNITATISCAACLGAACVFEQIIRDASGFAFAPLGTKLMLSLVVPHKCLIFWDRTPFQDHPL